MSRGCGAVVVTLGGEGSVYVDTERVLAVPGFPVPVVDTVAAGDAFCGALVVGLAEHRDLEEAASLAVAAASLSTTALGARGLLATRAESESLATSLYRQPLTR